MTITGAMVMTANLEIETFRKVAGRLEPKGNR